MKEYFTVGKIKYEDQNQQIHWHLNIITRMK